LFADSQQDKGFQKELLQQEIHHMRESKTSPMFGICLHTEGVMGGRIEIEEETDNVSDGKGYRMIEP
jgi:hypothetical protein